jgi:hypothetical protein
MNFPFPAIAGKCPVCERGCGAVYRGYYRRGAICPAALFVGFVAIRTGFCKATRRRFALFPDFLIPFRSFSRAAFLWLWEAWRESPRDLGTAVDRWFEAFHREISIAVSTLDSQLRFILRQLSAGHQIFGLPPLTSVRLAYGLDLPVSTGERAIHHQAFGVAASSRIDPPP